MTENEAIEALRLINTSRVHPFYSWEEMAEVRDIAISALKEVQQYRKIGTVEECKEMAVIANKKTNPDELAKIIVEWIQYNKIGTVEECREAVEKQKAKKPLGGVDIEGNEYMICSYCSAIVEDGGWRADYCPDCGQSIKWDENLEGIKDGQM